MNHTHNPSERQLSNCVMARMVTHGLAEDVTYGKNAIDEQPAWCPNAFSVVVVGEKAYVACSELANVPADVRGWEGFKLFGKLNGQTALNRAADWIHEFPDALRRPMVVFGYEPMIRSFSPRFYGRVLSTLFSHLKKAKATDCAKQASARSNGDRVTVQLIENGQVACTHVCSPDDFAKNKAYHPYFGEVVRYAKRGYVSMEHVFDGGDPTRVLPKQFEVMKESKRKHFARDLAAHGDPIGNIHVSPVGPVRPPGQIALELELQRRNLALVAAAKALREQAAAVRADADAHAEAMRADADVHAVAAEEAAMEAEENIPLAQHVVPPGAYLSQAERQASTCHICVVYGRRLKRPCYHAGVDALQYGSKRNTLLVGMYRIAEGRAGVVITSAQLKADPVLAVIVERSGRSAMSSLVGRKAVEFVRDVARPHVGTGMYRLTPKGVADAETLLS